MTVKIPVTNFTGGMNTYLQPSALPDDAFPDLEDVVCYRGYLRKRDGFESLIVPQDGAGIAIFPIPGVGITNANPGQVTTVSPHGLVTGNQVTIIGVQGMTQIGDQKTITGISKNTNAEITTSANHGYYTGQMVLISGTIVGMLDPNSTSTVSPLVSTVPYSITVTGANTFTIPLNTLALTDYVSGGITTTTNPYTVTKTGANTFTIGIDTTAFGVYTGGGIIQSIPYMGYLAITGVSNTNPAQITTAVAHNLITGQQVQIINVEGVDTGTNNEISVINNNVTGGPLQPYTITRTGPNTFTVPVNALAATAYIRSGTVCQPVMGLLPFLPTSNEFFPKLIAFNESQAFLYNDSTQDFDNISKNTAAMAISWTGTDSDFFWATNYSGSFWATNNVNADGIRYLFNGSAGWVNFAPQVDSGGTTLTTCLMLFPYKDRLVALNTTENVSGTPIGFPQRARWSQNGTPYVAAAAGDRPPNVAGDADAWRQDIVGKGGWIDAPTSEQIVTAGFVRDTLVVMFERSAWRLRYTGNETLPFIWERIDSTYGAQSTFSNITFDTGLMSVGKFGTTLTTVNACERIDYQIADQIFQIQQANFGNFRVYGVRDYQRQLAYWLYPDVSGSNESTVNAYYPNKALVYNYIEQTWSLFNWNFTCFGTYKRVLSATWGNTFSQWQVTNTLWGSGFDNADNPQIIAGDPFGQVMIFTPGLTDDNGYAFNWSVTTKQYNPFIDQELQAKAIYLYFYVDGTEGGQFTVQHFIDNNNDESTEITPADPNQYPTGNPIGLTVNTNDTTGQTKVWRRIGLSGTAQFHQFKFTFSQPQLQDGAQVIPFESYNIYKFILEMAPAGRLNYGEDTIA